MSRPHQHRSARSVLATAVGLVVAGLTLTTWTAPASAASRTVVHADESIQNALDHAAPNSVIVVTGGVHAEQLTISKDGITLIGIHTRLVPPSNPVTNTCSGLAGSVADPGPPTQAGICVTGRDVTLADFQVEHRKLVSVGEPVRGVTIAGFRVEGFSGANIAVVGAADTRLDVNTLVDGAKYGALTVGSTDTRVTRNVVSTSSVRDIGVCVDDVTPAVVDHNDVSGYGVGLCVQTQGADVRNNAVHDNCVGIFVDPGIGANVRNNRISSNNAPCPQFVNGIGVWLLGTNGTTVIGNRITGHTPEGFGAAVILQDDATSVATNNTIRDNRLRENSLDILLDSHGSGNTIANNRCTSSQPGGLCDRPQRPGR